MADLRDTENMRSLAQMMARDPVDAALSALACLSSQDRKRLAAKFNAVFGENRPNPIRLHFEEPRHG